MQVKIIMRNKSTHKIVRNNHSRKNKGRFHFVYLDHCNVRLCSLESLFVCHARCKVAQLTALCDLDARLCNRLPNRVLVDEERKKEKEKVMLG
jgi:hypothetical protein